MPTTFSITIKNANSERRRYTVTSALPKVTGAGTSVVVPIVWFRTRVLQPSDQENFKYTSEYSGFVGNDNTDSATLAAGSDISLTSYQPVKVGTVLNDGTELLVSLQDEDSVSIKDTGTNNSKQDTYSILVDRSIPSPNSFVVGLSRKLERNGQVVPAAAVKLKPSATFIFTPDQTIRISAGEENVGQTVAIASEAAAVKFQGNQKNATVSEDSNGKFTVSYS